MVFGKGSRDCLPGWREHRVNKTAARVDAIQACRGLLDAFIVAQNAPGTRLYCEGIVRLDDLERRTAEDKNLSDEQDGKTD